MIAAAIQYRPPKGEPALARQALAELADEAGRQGATLIVAPEMATTGYMWASPEEILPHTEPARGPTLAALAPVAARHGAWIVCGFAERDGEALYNSALIVGPDGRAGTYRKVLLYRADETWARPGDQRMYFEHAGRRLLPAICMDMNDDGLILALHRAGIDVLPFCTNWVEEGIDVWGYWRARLAGWPGALVAADTWGEDRGTVFAGRSVIWGADGVVRASAGPTGDAVLVAEI